MNTIKRVLVLCVMTAMAAGTGAACNKPSESDCKRAIQNIRVLLGTDKLSQNSSSNAAWVRSCRGNAKKSSVKCAIEASTIEQLQRCGLLEGEEMDEMIRLEKEERERERAAAGSGTAAGAGTGTGIGTAAGTGAGTAAGTGAGTADGTGAGTGTGTAAGSGGGTGGAATP